MNLYEKIITLTNSRNKSEKEIFEFLGIEFQKSSYYRIKNDESTLDFKQVIHLLDYLGCSDDERVWFLSGSGEKPETPMSPAEKIIMEKLSKIENRLNQIFILKWVYYLIVLFNRNRRDSCLRKF